MDDEENNATFPRRSIPGREGLKRRAWLAGRGGTRAGQGRSGKANILTVLSGMDGSENKCFRMSTGGWQRLRGKVRKGQVR